MWPRIIRLVELILPDKEFEDTKALVDGKRSPTDDEFTDLCRAYRVVGIVKSPDGHWKHAMEGYIGLGLAAGKGEKKRAIVY
jgi:hypothetical protein